MASEQAIAMADRKDNHYPPQPEMAYAPPEYHNLPNEGSAAAATPATHHNVAPRYVTPLAQLKNTPKEVDCPYCRRVVMTRVQTVDASGSGMMMCLICLVCWPILFCYEADQDINHHCSVCGKQLTHQPFGGMVSVVAEPANATQSLVVSAFEHGGEVQQPQQQPQQHHEQQQSQEQQGDRSGK